MQNYQRYQKLIHITVYYKSYSFVWETNSHAFMRQGAMFNHLFNIELALEIIHYQIKTTLILENLDAFPAFSSSANWNDDEVQCLD